MRDPYIIDLDPEALRRAILDLRDDFEFHIHDGSTSRQLEDIIARSISARASITAQSIILATGGYLRSGQTAYDTGTGFWMGTTGGVIKFSLGNSSGSKLTWDNTILTVTGTIQTASSGQRVVISGADNNLKFFDSNGDERLSIGSDATYANKITGRSGAAGGFFFVSAIDNSKGLLIQSTSNVTVNGIDVSLTDTGSGNDGNGIFVDHRGAGRCIDLRPGTATAGLYINGDSTGDSIEIIHAGDTSKALDITYSGRSNGIYLEGADANATAPTMYVTGNISDASVPIVKIERSVIGNAILQIYSNLTTSSNHVGLEINMTASTTTTPHAISFSSNTFVASAVTGTQNRKIRVMLNGATYYIPCYDA